MLPKRSTLSAMLLTSTVLSVCAVFTSPVRSEDTPATTPAATTPAAATDAATTEAATTEAAPITSVAPDSPLKKLADGFLHYSIIGNLPLAHDYGQTILNQKPDPKDLLVAFEEASDGRDPSTILERDLKQPLLKDVSQSLIEQIQEGYRQVSRNPARIKADIEKLSDSLRAYQNAKDHLTAAGEYAVPYYNQYLQNNKYKNLHPYIIRIMTEIGKPLLPALVQQLQTPNDAEKLTLVPIMGEIGYPLAVPYLKALAQDDKALPELRSAATNALVKINEKSGLAKGTAADSFQVLAQSYYDSRPSVAPADPTEKTNPVWYYRKELNNVEARFVATAIWNDVEAMRAAEAAMRLEPNKPAAISLWVAANLRRELHLPKGASDPTRPAGTPDANFFALAAGPIYLNPVLNMALNDRDAALVLRTLWAMEATGATQGTVATATKAGNPLVRALGFPDRAVRFNAAFALGRSNPARDFAGSFRVVPILSEAVSQSNTPHIVLVDKDEQNRALLRSKLTDLNYIVHAGSTLTVAMSDAASASSFDAMIVPSTEALHAAELAVSDYRLTAIPVVVTADAEHLPTLNAELAHIGPMFKSASVDIDATALQFQIAEMKKAVVTTPVDDSTAMQFALTSIGILDNLAMDKQSIFKVVDAIPALTEALKDKRAEVALAAAVALGKINSPVAQKSVSDRIFAEGVDSKLKKVLLDALANSAKVAGNHVDTASVDKLIAIVTSDGDPEIRSSAAKAVGALNVQSDQASKLILEQAK